MEFQVVDSKSVTKWDTNDNLISRLKKNKNIKDAAAAEFVSEAEATVALNAAAD